MGQPTAVSSSPGGADREGNKSNEKAQTSFTSYDPLEIGSNAVDG